MLIAPAKSHRYRFLPEFHNCVDFDHLFVRELPLALHALIMGGIHVKEAAKKIARSRMFFSVKNVVTGQIIGV